MIRFKSFAENSPALTHFLLVVIVMFFQFHSDLSAFTPITLLAFFSMYWKSVRRYLLIFLCILSALMVGYPYLNIQTDVRLGSYVLFLIWSQLLVGFIIGKFQYLRRNYFFSLTFIYVSSLGIIYYIFRDEYIKTEIINVYIALSLIGFWYLCDFLKYKIKDGGNLSVFWVRPFWSSWIIPYDSPSSWSQYIENPISVREINSSVFNSIKIFIPILAGIFLFENICFEKPILTIDLNFSLFSLPLTYRDGFKVLLDHYSKTEIFFSQFFTVLHFLMYTYVFSTLSILCGQLAGFRIRPHTLDFWNASRFADFYFKTTFHYSRVIKTHVIEAFLRFSILKKLGFLRNTFLIFFSVFLAGLISMYLGRGLTLNLDTSATNRNFLIFKNYHYAFIMALFCGLSILFNEFKFKLHLPQKAKVLFYLLLSTFALVFGFHYLKTPFEIKIEVIKRLFQ